ncbi:MAG: hypothetical protein HY555_06290 [Euryarchaeota archaeon]|nr:hypothetical protein [Euryarchaeota archaeon]
MLKALARFMKVPIIFTLFLLWGHILAVYYGTHGELASPLEAKPVLEKGALKVGQHFEYELELMKGRYGGVLTFDVVEESEGGFRVQGRINLTAASLLAGRSRFADLELQGGRATVVEEEFQLDKDGRPKLLTYTSAFWNPQASCAAALPAKERTEGTMPEGDVRLDPDLPLPVWYEGPLCHHGVHVKMVLRDYRYNPA